MISQTAEYALRAIVTLAKEGGGPTITSRIADTTLVPPGYLYKVLQQLGRSGLVRSQRGLKGGFYLTKPADRISVLEVVNAVDPLMRIVRCPLGLSEHGTNLCPLHKKLDDATANLERVFSETMISELLIHPSRPVPLCTLPPRAAGI